METDPLSPNREETTSSRFSLLWNSVKVPILAISYCTISISAVFVNKVILSKSGRYKGFGSVEFLMLVQAVLGAIFLLLMKGLKLLKFEIKLDKQRYLRIALINLLFVLMTCANAYGIQYLAMPMVALLKNLQVVVVAFLDFYILGNKPGKTTIASLCVIVGGSICGSLTDLEFNLVGYIAMAVAIFTSALYFVFIKIVFKNHKVSEVSLVFYNNIFSIPFFLVTSLRGGAFMRALNFTLHAEKKFWFFLALSGFAGAGVNLTTYMFLAATSPTAFSVLSVIKKITQTLLGYIFWRSPANTSNVISVFVGVLGGIAYNISKKHDKDEAEKRKIKAFQEPKGPISV